MLTISFETPKLPGSIPSVHGTIHMTGSQLHPCTKWDDKRLQYRQYHPYWLECCAVRLLGFLSESVAPSFCHRLQLLTLKVVSESRVTRCANFSLPVPLCSRVRPDVRDRQTDIRQNHRLMSPPYVGGACQVCITCKLMFIANYIVPSWNYVIVHWVYLSSRKTQPACIHNMWHKGAIVLVNFITYMISQFTFIKNSCWYIKMA